MTNVNTSTATLPTSPCKFAVDDIITMWHPGYFRVVSVQWGQLHGQTYREFTWLISGVRIIDKYGYIIKRPNTTKIVEESYCKLVTSQMIVTKRDEDIKRIKEGWDRQIEALRSFNL